jgi:hypothetical protein
LLAQRGLTEELEPLESSSEEEPNGIQVGLAKAMRKKLENLLRQ